jgi:hypothetical protein
MEQPTNQKVKWPEILSLAGLNAAVVISWIAYHEYQPVLLEKFEFNELADFLVITKGIVLVIIPPIAGYFTDLMLKKKGKSFTVFAIGIAATAMIFMVVASIIGAGPASTVRDYLPIMIILWLIAMNLFISPANSMLEAFAPAKKLPLVMGVLFLITEIIYGLEPLVVALVNFFGDTLTFVVGGVLIAGTGILFHKVSSNEVVSRKANLIKQDNRSKSNLVYLAILMIGLQLGLGKAILVEFFPNYVSAQFNDYQDAGGILAFVLLGYSAILGYLVSRFIANYKLANVILLSFAVIFTGGTLLLVSGSFVWFMVGAFIVASGFSFINVSGLPFVLNNLTVKHVTYGVGIFYGASEIITGLVEYYYHI